MLELIRKSLLAGLGAGVITKEKAQQAAQELVDEGKLAADDAKQFVDRLLEGANEQREEFQASIRDAVRKALDSTDVARTSTWTYRGCANERRSTRSKSKAGA